MKTNLFSILLFALITAVFQPVSAANPVNPDDLKVIVSAKKIWFVADEMPVKCLCIKVSDKEGKVVLEKCLTSKMSDWSLDLTTLSKGTYTLHIGKEKTQQFKH